MRCLCTAELCVDVERMRWNQFIVWSIWPWRFFAVFLLLLLFPLRLSVAVCDRYVCSTYTAETADCSFVRQSRTDRRTWCIESVRMRRACIFSSCDRSKLIFHVIVSFHASSGPKCSKKCSFVVQVVVGKRSQNLWGEKNRVIWMSPWHSRNNH